MDLKAQKYYNDNIVSRLGVYHDNVAKLLRKKNKFE